MMTPRRFGSAGLACSAALAFCLFSVRPLLAQSAEPDSADAAPAVDLHFSGALWFTAAYQDWLSQDVARKRGLRFDNLRLAFDGTYGDHVLFSAQYRLYGFMGAIHHGWIGYQDERHRVEFGITQVPFGLLPFATNSFWFGLGYYVGLEDDYDAGLKWQYTVDGLDLHLAFFRNEQYGDATNLERYDTDVVRVDDQQNEEVNQLNARLAYTLGRESSASSEIGVSGQIAELDNRTTLRTGNSWAAAVHYRGRYGDWNPELQLSRYEFNPENPDGVDDRLILMGNQTSTRLVAAKGTLVNVNLRRFFEVNKGVFQRFNVYYNYSHLFKDEEEFPDSQLHNPGGVLEFGPFWVWIDFLWGKNAWYLNDSLENSGMGAGGTNDWEFRYNLSFEWYF